MTSTAREFHLAARPTGTPGPEHFRLVERELPDPGPGQVLVRNEVLSVDPDMRGRMNDVKSYVPPFQFGAARVIGSAGGPQKAKALVETFGFDAAIDYRAGDLAGQLAQAAPKGIDVYFDNVGGEHLEAALGALRKNGRVALCGSISGYNSA